MDAVGSAIRVDTRGREVVRILPRNNDAVNEEWISDKTRHVADGLRIQRLDRPYVRKNGRLVPASWDEALALVAAKLKATRPERIGAIAGDLAGAEEMFALKAPARAARRRATSTAGRTAPSSIRAWAAASYLFNAHHRGHRAGRRHPAGRHQSAPGGGRAQRAHPQALAPGRARRGADRRAGRSHLPLRIPGRRAADAERGGRRQAELRQRSARGQAADGDRRQRRGGAGRRRGGAGGRGAARAAGRCRARKRAGTRFNVLHTAALARGAASISASCRARAGSTWPACCAAAGKGAPRRGLPAGRRRDRHAGARQGLRHLPGQPRRRRRAARRRDPAGRRLHREERHLRQHRGPGADDGKAAFAPGDAKEDWAIVRALSAPCRPHAALRQPSGAAGGHVQGGAGAGAARCGRRRPAIAGRRGAGGAWRCARLRAVRARRCATST